MWHEDLRAAQFTVMSPRCVSFGFRRAFEGLATDKAGDVQMSHAAVPKPTTPEVKVAVEPLVVRDDHAMRTTEIFRFHRGVASSLGQRIFTRMLTHEEAEAAGREQTQDARERALLPGDRAKAYWSQAVGLAAREREACRKQRSRYSSACTFMKMLNRCQDCERRGHYHWRRFAASNTAPGRGQLRCRLRLCADAVSSVCALAMAWAGGICPRRARA